MDWQVYGNITEDEYNQIYDICVKINNIGGGWQLDALLEMISQERYKEYRKRNPLLDTFSISRQVVEKIRAKGIKFYS